MAGASDKARFYLEQSVPELREWERREIFTKDEITAIAAKRSEFEHVLNARGSRPSDYARYAEYEMNLDALRRKRVKRKGVKATAHSGQRRIFLILDRATKKFHGDLGLWMQYIEYARKQKANKKLKKILTDVLRMHPTKAELWVYAARYAIEVQGDMAIARTYMQRGLRFCATSNMIYLEYARLEMGYVAKIAARRKILGIDLSKSKTDELAGQEPDTDTDMIALPTYTEEDLDADEKRKTSSLEDSAMVDLAQTPALNGAIPIAIFEAAAAKFSKDAAIAQAFFDMFCDFATVPYAPKLLQTVLDHLKALFPDSVEAHNCQCRTYIVGIPYDSLEFPTALGRTAKEIRASLASVPSSSRPALSEKILSWLRPVGETDGLAPELKQIVFASEKRLEKEIP